MGECNVRQIKRLTGMVLTAGLLLGLLVTPAHAAARKKISSVTLVVTSSVLPETKYGDEEIEVEVRSGRCTFDYYDIENIGFEWLEDDVPEITIYLKADEGYYFSLTTASAVKLTGATYVKASKQDSSETLVLKVKLPSLAESVGDQGDVTLTDSGMAVWDEVRGAGSYEVRLYRNGTGIGATILTTDNLYYDFSSMMTRAGSYHVRVRPVNKIRTENKGEWAESRVIDLSKTQADAIRSGAVDKTIPVRGEWMNDGNGWWYKHHDGSYTKDNWETIKDEWYFFDENGYMKTGWIEWEGERYYCDLDTGTMLKNTTTPDGYILDHNGNPKTGR